MSFTAEQVYKGAVYQQKAYGMKLSPEESRKDALQKTFEGYLR